MRLEPCDGVYISTSIATVVISNRPCIVHGVILSPGSAASAITLLDPLTGTTSSTNAVTKLHVHGVANGASNSYNGSGSGLVFNNGCVAVVTGTGAQATVLVAKI
jgi:hypothetical protein